MDPALLAGVDGADDKDISFAGVHDKDTSFAGVPVPNPLIVTTQMTTQTQNLITTLLTPAMTMTIQAKHP